MKRTIFFVLLLIALFNASTSFSQTTTKWPKTLLWKITGNGLSKPSYLFGTLHLQDKRIFYFTDSLYSFLEKADGYALEVNMGEFIDSVFQKVIDEKEDDVLEKNSRNSDAVKIDVVDTLVENVSKRNDKASRKRLQEFRKQMIKAALKKEEMPTIMDAYLYGIALRQGKWVGGIEDVQDQLPLLNEFGQEVSKKEFKSSSFDFASALEKMIQIYLRQDIAEIENFSRSDMDEKGEDTVMVRRNKKMAYRMDSLSHIRSMFFAVGAAHLGGEKGVIRLLRSRGFEVDPVFSSKLIEPLQYASKLDKLPWEKVADIGETYQIEMPGKPSDLNMFGEMLKMKMFVDITTLTYYMSGSIISQPNIDLHKIMDKLGTKADRSLKDVKTFEKDGMKGIEGIMMSEGVYFKVQYLQKGRFVYMLMAGNEKQKSLKGDDVKRFFLSFTPKDKPAPVAKEWQTFTESEKAFTILVPAKPKRNSSVDRKSIGSQWAFSTYDCYDSLTNTYYMFQARDIRSGYYLMGDSVFFDSFKENMVTVVDSIYEEKFTTWKNFPSYWMTGRTKEENLHYRCRILNRGNRVYMLLAINSGENADEEGPHNFFDSFSLLDYKPAEWKTQQGPGFYSTLPAAIRKKNNDIKSQETKTEENLIEYVSYNSSDATTYHIMKSPVGPYYWEKNDTSFYGSALNQYVNFGDSIIEQKRVKNGKVEGLEWTLFVPKNNLRKKARLFVHGDTLYTILAFIPSQYIDNSDHHRFFEDFRFADEDLKTNIYQSKAGKLFADLNSTDSTTYVSATEALYSANFDKTDIPQLLDGLIASYPAENLDYTWRDPRAIIATKLETLADNSTITGIENRYLSLSGEKEEYKWGILELLAKIKTTSSFKSLKKLLIDHTPKRKDGFQSLQYSMDDSLELALSLYPEILSLSKDTIFDLELAAITSELVDSNLIKITTLLPYKSNFLKSADRSIIELRDPDKWSFYYTSLIRLLAAFKEEDSNRKLQEMLVVEDLDFKTELILALIRNNQPVPKKDIDSVAASKMHRKDFYDELEKLGKVNLFPLKYATQRGMAESIIFNYAMDEYEPTEIKLIAEKTDKVGSIQSRYFLFKITFKYDDEEGVPESYLGMVGPFAMDVKNLKTDNSRTQLEWEEQFDPKKVEKTFRKWIEEKQ